MQCLLHGAAVVFQCLACLFQLGDCLFKAQVFLAYQGLRLGDDILRQSQPLADGEGVGLSGRPQDQPVGGTERFDVELTGGVQHIGLFGGVEFQFLIVGGDHKLCAVVLQPLDHCLCQRRTLDGVCAGA